MRYDRGDVVWGPDPYHSSDPFMDSGRARPWLVLSSSAYPRQGQDYMCCARTSTGRRDPNFIALTEADWDVGRPPKPSSIDPQTVMVVKDAWIKNAIGRLSEGKTDFVRDTIKGYL